MIVEGLTGMIACVLVCQALLSLVLDCGFATLFNVIGFARLFSLHDLEGQGAIEARVIRQ